MNVFRLLEHDHTEIDGLLARLEQPAGKADFDGSGRRYLLDRLVSVAARHEAAEEMTFWPQVRRRLPDGHELADQALGAESEAKAVLDLLRFVKSEPEIVRESAQLRAMIREHATFEEQIVFPRMAKSTTRVWATMAGMRFRAARRTGPTRPHPGGPDRPLGLATVGAPSVLLDHLRDLRSRQRRHPIGFEAPDRANAIAVLTRDHARIGRLLAELETQEDPDEVLLHTAIRELSIHDSIERQYLYPVVRRRLEDGNQRYEQLISEHGHITRRAADLDVYSFHDGARQSWIKELSTRTRTHIEQEEAGVLAPLAARMTDEELVDLGELLESGRTKAPTRPHRYVAGAGLGARLSRLVAGPLDKTRDALPGRRTG